MINSSPPCHRRCRRRPAAASSALGEAADQHEMLVSKPTASGEGHPTVAIEGNASEQPPAPAQDPPAQDPPTADPAEKPLSRRAVRRAQIERFVQAVRDSDVAAADEAILRLSRSRRWLAPLALIVGAFVMLFAGV